MDLVESFENEFEGVEKGLEEGFDNVDDELKSLVGGRKSSKSRKVRKSRKSHGGRRRACPKYCRRKSVRCKSYARVHHSRKSRAHAKKAFHHMKKSLAHAHIAAHKQL